MNTFPAPNKVSPGPRRLRLFASLIGICAFGLAATQAHAVPSYARQTGAECAACHIGGYGPQLTPYGIQFKIGGYTETDGKSGKIPLSGMLVANWTHTAKKAADGDVINHFDANNNDAVQEASVFLAGRLADKIGTFTQSTYSGVDRKWALDQVDIRFVNNLKIFDKKAVVGISLNSNPTLTDPFNTLGQWRFPYTASDFNAGLGSSPMVENLAGSVVGINAYTFFNNNIYAELGVYNSLSKMAINAVNFADAGKFKGPGIYGRAAYFKERTLDNFSVGLLGFETTLQPDRVSGGATDHYRDLGIDAQYQYTGNHRHIFTANASYINEAQKLNNLSPDQASNHLNQFRIATSYTYRETWGGTVALFDSRGASNATVNPDALNGRPDTSGYILQADWTPWGKETSWHAPFANVRIGVQYTGYNKFMGGSSYNDADGNLRKASDNNTTMLFLWTAI